MKNICLLSLCICVLNRALTRQFLFQHQQRHTMLRVQNCWEFPANSVIVCASKCASKHKCLTYVYDESQQLCKYSCDVFWERKATNSVGIFYGRKSVNVALNKVATMSSVHKGDPRHHSSYAIDGVLSAEIWGLESAHSAGEQSPWIQVDLGKVYNLDLIIIYNRWEDLGERLHDIKLLIDGVPSLCEEYEGPGLNAQVIYVSCQTGTTGRFVKLYIDGSADEVNYLTISELELRQFKC